MMVSAALNRLPLISMKLVTCVSASLSSTGVSICASGCNWMDLFRIPDKLMWVTLSLSGSTSIALSSSCVSDLDGSAAMVWFFWL